MNYNINLLIEKTLHSIRTFNSIMNKGVIYIIQVEKVLWEGQKVTPPQRK
jgi:hypothetical protein